MILKRCPLCKDTIKLPEEEAFTYCENCKSVINNLYRKASYDRDYFMDDYEEQYGKTYIDDFDSIYNNSVKRLQEISQFIKIKKEISLLDIGSAAGFFLKAAKDKGIDRVLGIEISEFASQYCRESFSIPVIRDSFENVSVDQRFDIVTSWFFIEHCDNPLEVFTRIYNMLNDSGVLAFSVPSCYGPMYYFNRSEWEKTHPQDHLINMSPFTAKKILQKIGFSKVRVIRSGFHPERIIKKESPFYGIFSGIYKIYTDITAFSDTIEIYAVK